MGQIDPVVLKFKADVADYNAKIASATNLTEERLVQIERAGERMGTSVQTSLDRVGTSAKQLDENVSHARESLNATKEVAKQTEERLVDIEHSGERMGASIRTSFGSVVTSVGELDATVGKVQRGFNLAKEAAVGYLGVIAAHEVVEAIGEGLEFAASLGEVAQQLGVTTDALQEYRYAATQYGLSQEEIDQALSQLTRRAGEAANGTKEQAAAFDRLGISVRDAGGKIIATGDLIPKIAESLTRIADPAERATIEMDLFGRAGQKLEPLLLQGADGVDRLREAAHDLGIVLSGGTIAAADEAADKMSELKLVLQANFAGAVAHNADAIIGLANALTTLATTALHVMSVMDKLYASLPSVRPLYGGQDSVFSGTIDGIFGPGTVPSSTNAGAGSGRSGGTSSGKRSIDIALDAISDAQGQARSYLDLHPVHVAAPSAGRSARSGGGGSGASSNADAHRQARSNDRVQDDLARDNEDILRATADRTGTLDDKYAQLATALDNELASYKRRIATDEDITAAQASQLVAAKATAIAAQKAALEDQKRREIAEQQYQIASDANAAAQDDARSALSLAATRKEQLALELRILALQQAQQRADAERLIASKSLTDRRKGEAQLATLDQRQANQRTAVSQQYASPLQKYAHDLSTADIGDQVEGYAIDELQALRDKLHSGIAKVIGTKDPFITGLIDILIQNLVLKPLANSLAGASSGGGGLFGSILSGLGSVLGAGNGIGAAGTSSFNKSFDATFAPARASGGYVSPGQMYRVNEGAGAGRVEGFIPNGGGQVVPLGQMNAALGNQQRTAPAVVQVHVMEGQLFEPRVQAISGNVAVEVHRATRAGLISDATANTLATAQRTRM